MAEKAKPVDLMTIDPFKLEGDHIAKGTVLFGVESELAKELTGAGRTRLATDTEVADAKKAAKKAEKAEA